MATLKGRGKKERPVRKVAEAGAVYAVAGERTPPPQVVTGVTVTRLSSKNQITVPVAYVRALNLRAGDEIQLTVIGDMLVGHRRPQTKDERHALLRGAMAYPEWETPEKVNAWVRGERDSWDREWDQDETS
jgi:bifunctional DNA-binding transcriptional regulator/antitoxin component of YhaV-PrlF toxin-antitoxin module